MKILVVGGNGTIGKRVADYYKGKHKVITAGRNNADVFTDITKKVSIKEMFEKTGLVDAIVCASGAVKWGPFNELSEEDFYIGITSKMMGQVNLVRIGKDYLTPGGSITLTTTSSGSLPEL